MIPLIALPHSPEAERAVLGSILLDNQIMEEVAGDDSELFHLQKHQKLFSAYQGLHLASKPIDLLTLPIELGEDFDQIGGIAFLAQLDLDLPDLGRIDTYLEILRNYQGCRKLIALSLQCMVEASSGGVAEARDMADALAHEAGLVAASRTASSLVSMGEVLEATAASVEAGQAVVDLVKTGYIDLDKKLGGGVSPGTLILVAGRPGMGKTALALNIAQNTSSTMVSTGIFSLEMGKEELGLRIMAGELQISFSDLKSGNVDPSKRHLLAPIAAEMLTYPLYVNDRANQNVTQILADAKKRKLRVIVIDYVQIMNGEGRTENRNLEIGSISRRLKQGAKDLRATVILLSQLSRDNEKRGDKRPQLSDLRDSGSLEQDADLVAFLYREDYYEPYCALDRRGVTEVNIAKHRNGETGIVELLFESRYTTFHNLSRREPPAR